MTATTTFQDLPVVIEVICGPETYMHITLIKAVSSNLIGQLEVVSTYIHTYQLLELQSPAKSKLLTSIYSWQQLPRSITHSMRQQI